MLVPAKANAGKKQQAFELKGQKVLTVWGLLIKTAKEVTVPLYKDFPWSSA